MITKAVVRNEKAATMHPSFKLTALRRLFQSSAKEVLTNERQCGDGEPVRPGARAAEQPECQVKAQANKEAIRKAARVVYNRAGRKPPNLVEAPKEITEVLKGQSMKTSRQRIREVLHEPEFKTKRLGRGERPPKD